MGCAQAHVQPSPSEVAPGLADTAWSAGTKVHEGHHKQLRPDEIVKARHIREEMVMERSQAYPHEIVIAGMEVDQPKCMGTFMKCDYTPEPFHDYRPIYKNGRRRFLYFHAEKRVWQISFSFTDDEGVLRSPPDELLPPTSNRWEVCSGSTWNYAPRITTTVKVEQKDKLHRGDYVRVKQGSGSALFHEGERGVIVGKYSGSYRVHFEGRPSTVTVASWHLTHLPEDFTIKGDIPKKVESFSLPAMHTDGERS